MADAPNVLCAPLELPCGATLKNRIAKASMTEGLAGVDDHANERHARLYERWSKGGCGLLLTGNVMIDRRYLERPGNIVIEDDTGLEPLKRMAEAGTSGGSHLWMQISHPGRQVSRIVSNRPISPSSVQLKLGGLYGRPTPMTEGQIEDAITRYVTTATIAKRAGFTGVQIHGAHGYLISQFLSPRVNQREDQWGGALENRSRFLIEIVRRVREAVGDGFPVAVKLNSSDFQKGAFTLEDCVEVAKRLQAERIDLLEISGGTYERLTFLETDDQRRETTKRREAFFLEYAETIRASFSSPLMVTGGFRSRAAMTEALEQKVLDVIGLARPLCVDPSAAQKLIDEQIEVAEAYEDGLVLGSGWFGPNSTNNTLKGLNAMSQVNWYYRQILRLSDGEEPDLKLTARSALIQHNRGEWALARARRKEHR